MSPIVLQIKPNVRIRLSGLGLLHGWEILEVLGTLVLEMPRLGSWLDCAWLYYNFSTGNASFGVLAGLCLVIVQL